MTHQPKILAFAGSLRTGSYNKSLAKIAAEGAKEAGAIVTYIDLKDFPLPIYDADIEQREGLPQNALKLKELLLLNDGWIIASPENNSSISSLLKNVIDWVSRPATLEEKNLVCFIDKVAVILSASPSNLGGLRGLVQLRSILNNLFTFVLPRQKTIANAQAAFDSEGKLKNEKDHQAVKDLGKDLTKILIKLSS
jgi:chromate reductase, NAD(P)H dehydrogenase (quinone)